MRFWLERKQGKREAQSSPVSASLLSRAIRRSRRETTLHYQRWRASESESDGQSIAFSETNTLIEYDSHSLRITTAFQETDPKVRDAIYNQYLADPLSGDETDEQELDPYERAWHGITHHRSK